MNDALQGRVVGDGGMWLVERCNGHDIYRDIETNRYYLSTRGVGAWGFDIKTLAAARTTCEAVSAPAAQTQDGAK